MKNQLVIPLFRRLLAIVVLVVSTGTAGYCELPSRQFAWAGIYAEYTFAPRLGISLDLQARYEYTDGDWFQLLARTGIVYKLENGFQFSGGIARFSHYPDPNGKPPRPEWRPWQEAGYKLKRGHHTIFTRLRLEQRFIRGYNGDELADHYSFSAFRSRLRCDYTFRFDTTTTKGWSVFGGSELLVATRSFSFTALDQVRITAGTGYAFSSHISLQLAYLWLLQQKSSTEAEQQHIARLTLQLQF